MTHVLIAYDTRKGHTKIITDRIAFSRAHSRTSRS
jgi:hypothetical protein